MTQTHTYTPSSLVIEGSGIVGGLLGGGCFVAGTLVWTPTGLRAIEDVHYKSTLRTSTHAIALILRHYGQVITIANDSDRSARAYI